MSALQPRSQSDFRRRLQAWWQGAPVQNPVCGEEDTEQVCDVIGESKPKTVPEIQWTPELFAQEVWGEGCLGPGGDDYVLDLAKPLNPDSKKTMLLLSAELGGPARLVSEKFGSWVSAYESADLVTAEGIEQVTSAGVGRTVELKFQNFETLELPERKFGYALWKEGLFRVADKPRILHSIYESLKPGSGLIITDFVTPKRGDPSAGVMDWAGAEKITPTLWSVDEAMETLSGLKFKVPIHDDMSTAYQRIVIDAWKNWMEQLPSIQKERGLDAKLQSALVEELAYWVRRANVIKSGDLRVYRFLCLKPEDSLAGLE